MERTASVGPLAVPPPPVVGVGLQVGPRLLVRIVELGVYVVGLHEPGQHNRGERPGEFPVLLQHVLRDLTQAVHELLAVGLDGAFDLGALLPGAPEAGIVRAAWTELPLLAGLYSRAHV